MKTTLTLIVAVLTANFSMAQEVAEKSPAMKLMELMKIEQTMEDVSKLAFAPFLKQLKDQGVPDAGVKEVKEASDVYFGQVATDPDLKKEMAALYEKEFTPSELSELVEFYQSPLGQKTLKTLPALTQAGAKLGEKYAQKYAPPFREQLTRIINKYKGAAKKGNAGE